MKDFTYTSGLLPDSRQCVAMKARGETSQRVSISFRGLNDDDAYAVNPYSAQKDTSQQKAARAAFEVGKRNLSRQNQVRVHGLSLQVDNRLICNLI